MAFNNIAISEIKLRLTFASLGGSGTKYVTLWESTQSTITGSASSIRGASIGNPTVAGAYNATKTLTFNNSSNTGMFTHLRTYFSGGKDILILHVPTTRGTYSGGYCYDFLGVDGAQLEITYEYLRSTGMLANTSVAAGSAATLNITAFNSAYTHVVSWKFGSHTHTQNIAAGATSASYTIPLGWLSAIPNSTSGSASVTLDTRGAGGVSLGTYNYSFTITAPASVVPTISSVSASPVNSNSVLAGWGIYAQGRTSANLAINGASGVYGSTIKSYGITTNPSIGAASGASMQTGIINRSGTITITGTATDSRGRTATKTTTISVYAYAAPSFTPLDIFRCTSNGTRNDTDGTYVRIRATFGRSILSGSNNVSGSVRIQQVGGSYNTTQAIASGTGVTLGGGSIAIDATFTATFTITDTVGTVTTYVGEINSAAYVLHIKKGGKAIGFGMAAGADNTASFGWQSLFGTELARKASTSNMLYFGGNPGIVDTVANWTAKGFGWAWLSQTGQVTNQPAQYGFLLNIPIGTGGTECHQIFLQQADGFLFHRGGNASGWNGWRRCWDNVSLPIPLSIANGGTGQTSAQGVRNTLGLGNTTGALPVASGGTGATNATNAISNLGLSGALVVSASGNSGNHQYMRFSNGLQVCYGTHSWSAAMTTQLGGIYLTNTHGSFSFPVAFTSVISATGTKRGSVSNSGLYRMNASTTGLSGIAMFRGNSASATALQEVDYIVLGKWK